MSERMPALSGELLDVVDVYGQPTGQVLDKSIIHREGLPHRDVHLWLTNGSELLQQQRTWEKPIMPGCWDISVAGHVSAGESYLDAVERETSEELGLDFDRKRFIRLGRVTSQLLLPGWEKVHNIVGDNYVLVEPDLQISDLTLQEDEVLGARWYPIDELENDLVNPETRHLHAPQPGTLYALGIAGMRGAAA